MHATVNVRPPESSRRQPTPAQAAAAAFRSASLLDRVFWVGVGLKGLNGVLELVGGILLLVVSPSRLHLFALAITHKELSDRRERAAAQTEGR